ncbi:baseplate J/gp47 family protein [Lacticaseibacillus zhaodongensis]|uniref:baseplate J/gp47 family protein n=1 Tax=Lacticaseibacillus zhaodongensis TaxID=2668065 RepID=UPI0012D344BF|nr:baseplate J/gp47 family protein [Lacticaseibacillus zhaodongensis]
MLDEHGFSRPTYDELVNLLIDKWHELFGDNANVATNSVGGIFIRVIAFVLNQVYQLAEKVYQSQFADSATGVTLDQLAANQGLVRKAAQDAIGGIRIFGVAGYVVPAGFQVQTADGLTYVTTEDIKLVGTGQKVFHLDEAGYTTIDYNEEEIGTGESKLLYALGTGAGYNKPGAYADYPAVAVNPVEEVRAIEVEQISGGADLETDDQLRTRLEQASDEGPSSPMNGVISAISKVIGVNSVKIIANDTLEKDDSGNPPKTLHIYVDGGISDDIGPAIFNSVAAGVQTYGTIPVVLKDIAGMQHTVYYDRPTPLNVHVHIKLTTNDEFPIDGNDQIVAAVMAYVQSVPMGDAVRYSYLYRAIYDQVPGIVVADITIGPDTDHLAAQDIALGGVQRAACTTDMVVIDA